MNDFSVLIERIKGQESTSRQLLREAVEAIETLQAKVTAQAATIAEHPGNRAIAERITEELFVNGSGQEAYRLVLTSRDGRDLGGWSKGPLTDRIVGVLDAVPAART